MNATDILQVSLGYTIIHVRVLVSELPNVSSTKV